MTLINSARDLSGYLARRFRTPMQRSGRARTAIGGIGARALIVISAASVWPLHAAAAPEPACDIAARHAAALTDVPLSVLLSITRVETGRTEGGRLEPWPWTVNMEGKGHWFDNRDAARAFVHTEFQRGARSFDVGCFQVNYKWHGDAFRSIDHMFDPTENALYAAKFLAGLYAESGDWSAAAGAYHSRTPHYARKYRARFDRIRQTLHELPETGPLPAPRLTETPRRHAENNFPLLLPGAPPRTTGSLVPLGIASRGPLIAQRSGADGS
ncbi:transglycosylase SLT domain-containing protein [Roseovarius azorensis]